MCVSRDQVLPLQLFAIYEIEIVVNNPKCPSNPFAIQYLDATDYIEFAFGVNNLTGGVFSRDPKPLVIFALND